jgi:PAS domain S-box-containing protein
MSCVYASRRMVRFGKHFWLLISAGFFIWSAAQLMVIYYENIVHASLNEPWPSDIVFFLSMAPPFMTLFIDSERGLVWRDWPRFLDLAQVVILTVAADLFIFGPAAHWRTGGGMLARLSWIPESGRDIFLLAAFSLCAMSSRKKLPRDLYGRMAIFYIFYLSGELPYLYLQATKNLSSGTLWDLAWSLPFVGATILAATSKPGEATAASQVAPAGKELRRRGWNLVQIVPIVFPLVVLLMAAGVAENQLPVAVAMVLASFACSSGRIILGDREQRRFASDLEEKSALLRSIFEGSGDAISVKDLGGRYRFVNKALADIFKLPAEQIIGKTVGHFLDRASAQLLIEHDRMVIESGQTKAFEYPTADNGPARIFLTSKSPFRDAQRNATGVITISRDVTEYRAMEDRLRQSQKMEAIGTLAGGVAHDFNNILMVITGYSQVLIEALDRQPELRGPVEQIQKAGERAASLTRQLLAFSRKQTIQPTLLNLNSVVRGMEKLLHRLIGEDIAIVARLAPDLGTVEADAGQLEQLILNLAVNARDAMPQGGKLTLETKNVDRPAEIRSEASSGETGPHVQLEVRDTGIGIEPAVQGHIFEPFFTTKPKGKGTGLGLSTVYGIVEQAGGFVTFSSVLGEGTVFRVLLPRIDSKQSSASPAEGVTELYQGAETVLLVEDDPAVCELVRGILQSQGYKVLTARRPQDAEALCESHSDKVDLLLTDVIMPGFSGAELSKRLIAKRPELKVLFMSGYIDDSVVRQGVNKNEVSFLQKPFSPSSLAKKVREVLDATPAR